MILVIVYVGAVAVLFLFVVMMLDVDFAELREGYARYLPIALAIGAVLLSELIFVAAGWVIAPDAIGPALPANVTNAKAIGSVLYTDYLYFFELAGLTLLIAMIGAIVLTLRSREYAKRQDVGRQVSRSRSEAIALVNVESGKGLSS
jgi:NADH-quinone oxidoreductase subunit J